MYARFRTRSKFYTRPTRAQHAYNVEPNIMRRPKVKAGLLRGLHTDEQVDMRDRERLELLESIRHPRERDFYQDHTYHNQWVRRELEKHQKMQIAGRYRFFAPEFEIKPWIWYPGDIVEVIKGEGVGQRGTIIAVVKYKNEIVVQNINVQDVIIPASETRPEQVVQREHPISVTRVQHVDPSTNTLCHLDIVKVRNKETGIMEEKRMSLESGVLLPIPTIDETMEVGDPLKDTPIQDADESTYDRATEMSLLVERRLQAMENYFVKSLKDAYEFHAPLREKNAIDMQQFQVGVVRAATTTLAEELLASHPIHNNTDNNNNNNNNIKQESAWWEAGVAAHVEDIETEILNAAEEKAAEAAEAEAHARAQNGVGVEDEEVVEINSDDDEDDDDNNNNNNSNSDSDVSEKEENLNSETSNTTHS